LTKLLDSETLPDTSKPNDTLDKTSVRDTAVILAHSDYQHLAVLDTRILLDFGAFREASEVQTTLVHSYMRVVYSTPRHREYGYTGYPSEPIIAEAAARAMVLIQKQAGVDGIARILRPYVASGLVQTGERGELIARLLLIRAIDEAHTVTSPTNHSTAVSLAKFLKVLLGQNAWENHIQESVSDNTAESEGNSFSTVFKHAKVRFTHFGRASEDVSSAMTYAAFLRGMAIQCWSGQKPIDLVIPVIPETTTEEKVKEENITAIFIFIKNRSKPTSIASVSIMAEDIDFFPQTPIGKLYPYIVLVMELGVPEAAIKTTYNSPALRYNDPHPRYSIHVHGCSPEAYAVIEHRRVYADLLTPRELLNEHPRQEQEHLDAVHAMKPDWRTGAYYKWLKHPPLNQVKAG
jgi:hypothetical protein